MDPYEVAGGADDGLRVVGPPEMAMPGSQLLLMRLGVVLVVLGVLVALIAAALRWRRRRRLATDPELTPARRRPVVLSGAVVVALLGAVPVVANRPGRFFVPEFPPLPRLLPADAFFYRPATDLPVDADSDAQIDALGDLPVVPGSSSQVVDGVVFGRPFNLVDDDTARHRFTFTYEAASEPGEYPVTEPAYVESMPGYGIDDHYIGVDLEDRRMWEVFFIRNWFGRWSGLSGAVWDLDRLEYPKGATTASGLPMLPGLHTYAEVASGRIDHVLLLVSPVSAQGEFRWPARSSDGPSEDPDAPPMGTWLRLRADADLSGLAPQARVIAEALQTYGGIISDTGGNFGTTGTPDARWDDADLATLATLGTSDFEVVDPEGIMVAPDSMAVVAAGDHPPP